MIRIPTPIPRLCLTYEFDRIIEPPPVTAATTTNQNHHHPSTQVHDDIMKIAAHTLDTMIGFTQYGVTTKAFTATVIDSTSIDTVNMAHNLPFDPNFHVATTTRGPAIRYEFIYYNKMSTDGITILSSKLFLRIVTSFGKPEETIDGVTASRIGFMAIELLEGHKVHTTIFPQHQPVQFGIRHIFNFIYNNIIMGYLAIPWGYILLYLYMALECFGWKSSPDIARVNDIPSMLRFHSSKYAMEPARYQLYRSNDTNAFQSFLRITEQWAKSLGFCGYFYLLNVAPLTSPSMTWNIQDITKLEKRYQGVFAPTGPPPSGDIWNVINFALASKCMVNNYGNHKHNFTVTPVSFIWDWLHIRNSFHVAACISINGVFLSCFRGLSTSFDSLDITKDIFPDPVQNASANVTWETKIG